MRLNMLHLMYVNHRSNLFVFCSVLKFIKNYVQVQHCIYFPLLGYQIGYYECQRKGFKYILNLTIEFPEQDC